MMWRAISARPSPSDPPDDEEGNPVVGVVRALIAAGADPNASKVGVWQMLRSPPRHPTHCEPSHLELNGIP